MVHDKAAEEALLLAHGSDVSDRSSLESGLNEYDEKPRRRSFSHLSWLARRRSFSRSRSPLVSSLRRRIWLQSSRRKWPSQLLIFSGQAMMVILAIILIIFVFFPSYTYAPQRYTHLREQALKSNEPGRGNPRDEKAFIAASIRDKNGRLLSGDWGRNVLSLIDLLGPQNTFLSIYENDPDDKSIHALDKFSGKLKSQSALVHEHLNLTQFDRVIDLNGTPQLKRIAVLAEVRNRALLPLEDPASPASAKQWDKLLYLNDVVFDPIDAANLLFSTNVNSHTGRTDYRAACAVDFINPVKFYDTYATRDLEGFSIGVPFYPWFTDAGRGASRRDVLHQKDAVRVKSCWGGMVAFEAKWFQSQPRSVEQTSIESEPQQSYLDAALNTSLPLRFRSEPDTYWDASECCLIHADLEYRASTTSPENLPHSSTGIYMNPYIRVAYSTSVLKWLRFARRFERLYSPAHSLVNRIARLPRHNPRRLESPGDEVEDRVWRWNDEFLAAMESGTLEDLELADGGAEAFGEFVLEKRIATPGQFCGMRKQSVVMSLEKTGRRYGSSDLPSY